MVTVSQVSVCLAAKTERTPTGVRQWGLTAHAGTFEGAGQIQFFFDATLRKSSGNPASNFNQILPRHWQIRLRIRKMITRFDLRLTPQNRSLSEILDLTVLVPNDHRVPRIDYRYVERTVVFTLEQKLCLIL